MVTKFVVIFVTCSSRKEAGKILESLLKKRIVACGNIIDNIRSRFWWNGGIDNAKEALLTLKAKGRDFNRIEKEIRRIHSYDVPEVIALPIISGSRAYLDWIDESVK